QGPEQLTFRVGDIVQLHLDKVNAKGWGLGQANGKVGWFPGDFVEMPPPQMERSRSVQASKVHGKVRRSSSGGGGQTQARVAQQPPPPYPGRNQVWVCK
ncbi:unnamed protein product, partial [Choristocarpus tenellus]